ncbi:MAG: hypothetical protein ACLR33_06645, partial [Ruminococcus callidus]
TKNLTTHLSHNLCAVLPKETLHKARLTALHAQALCSVSLIPANIRRQKVLLSFHGEQDFFHCFTAYIRCFIRPCSAVCE